MLIKYQRFLFGRFFALSYITHHAKPFLESKPRSDRARRRGQSTNVKDRQPRHATPVLMTLLAQMLSGEAAYL